MQIFINHQIEECGGVQLNAPTANTREKTSMQILINHLGYDSRGSKRFVVKTAAPFARKRSGVTRQMS